ncbi:McrB family protein [Fibrobacter sp. UBA2449]|uniref:McrB family protein n=1 Tax=Fibrobacter sp. UBA2449 TaxID=1946529 RepID=UPI0025C2755B|nr:AAA family ATPase [Fibrobacter sp. UBA2449]
MSKITGEIITQAIASRSYKQPASSQKDARDLQISVDGMSFGLTTGNNTGGVSQNLYFDADASKVLLSFLKDLLKESKKFDQEIDTPIQSIFFGAPGTGKSFKIDDPEKGYGLKDVDESCKFRTTFHPDYDYAQFVGAYKPKKEGEKITYSFVPQVFAKAYAAAWKLYLEAKGDSRDSIGASPLQNDSGKDIQVYLVIEEINRGNCAQIFGDIFQLLDRISDGLDKGFSQYSIDADCDFATWLKENSVLKTVWSDYETKVGDGKLRLPPNLNILATMNTSDQSLFPMDSAFKRRFDWEYVPISFEGKDAANYQIDIDGSQYSWQNFVEAVNDKILDLTESEDKQLGEFFIKPDSGNVISKERFLGKVMFYLWNEVCKDEHKNGSFFRAKINDKEDFFTFQDLYKKKDLLKLFMDELLKKE